MPRYYPAILKREVGGGFGVSFPDFPACTAWGENEGAALATARDALALHIRDRLKEGHPLPVPTPVDNLGPAATDPARGRYIALVEGFVPSRSVRVNITFDENLLAEIDREATRRGTSRAGFLAAIARDELERTFQARLDSAARTGGRAIEAIKRLIAEEDEDDGPGPTFPGERD